MDHPKPVTVGIARLTHGHVGWLLNREERGDIEIVGIYEPDSDVVQHYEKRLGRLPAPVYSELDTMLDTCQPQAVTAFGAIVEHLEVVQACAPKGIHVMVEKPLAISFDHAQQMAAQAKEHGIHVLTNYETTWYASNHKAYAMVHEDQLIGDIRKIAVHDGHKGPAEIGVSPFFLDWLTDPVQNGGGAIIDFGCYGANLATWLMKNVLPTSVTAITQTLKPEIYPNVDDDSTIILTYPTMQAVVQGSWNWPIGRKDIEIYGQTGQIFALNQHDIRYRLTNGDRDQSIVMESRQQPYDDPFAFLAAVVRGDIVLADDDLSGLTNNLIVMRILDAARESAKTGKTIRFAS